MRKTINMLVVLLVLCGITSVTYAAADKNIKSANQVVNKNINYAAKSITDTALNYIGVPYRFGGTTPKGFDCSGFVQYVFNKHAKKLPRTADAQFKVGKSIFKGELKRGDLVFFTTYEPGVSHCGIYLEDGKFIHASSSHGIMISKLNDFYWKSRFVGARRII